MAEIPNTELEQFCYYVKDKFWDTYVGDGHYDKADLMSDITKFLKRFGVVVSKKES